MNQYKKSIFTWGRSKLTPEEQLEQEAKDELLRLDRDILDRELNAIEERFKIDGRIEQKRFLMAWMGGDAQQTHTPDKPTGKP